MENDPFATKGVNAVEYYKLHSIKKYRCQFWSWMVAHSHAKLNSVTKSSVCFLRGVSFNECMCFYNAQSLSVHERKGNHTTSVGFDIYSPISIPDAEEVTGDTITVMNLYGHVILCTLIFV